MATFHSQYRGDFANFPGGKNNGDEYQDLSSHLYKADHESGDGHKGKPVGSVSYQDGEFICRITVGQRDFYFRALELSGVQDQARRHFNAARGAISFKLDHAANLARHGEASAIGRL